MKNNRQVGLDGKIFFTSCLKRGSIYVLGLILFGLLNAFADILKLTGKSYRAMSSLTTSIITLDLMVSLLLVVVVFYAAFLECGSNIPIIKEKPLIILSYGRLAYNVILSYYIVYRAMYCIANGSDIAFGVIAFYVIYMLVTFLSIVACCYILNTLQRNMIRRVYIKSFRNLAIIGMSASMLMSLMYIVARFWIGETGDEYFTPALCDLLRLCIAPLLYSSIWMLFFKGRDVVTEIFGEVDAAIKERRYQITYTQVNDNTQPEQEDKKLNSSKAKAASAAATVAALEPEMNQLQIGPKQEAPAEAPQQTRESMIKDEKLRQAVSEAVAKAVAQEEAEMAQQPSQPQSAVQSAAQANVNMPVMEFDPYEQADRAIKSNQSAQKKGPAQKNNNQQRQNNNQRQNAAQRNPNQQRQTVQPKQMNGQQRPNNAQRSNNQARPANQQNQQRSNQSRPANQNNQQRNNQSRPANQQNQQRNSAQRYGQNPNNRNYRSGNH